MLIKTPTRLIFVEADGKGFLHTTTTDNGRKPTFHSYACESLAAFEQWLGQVTTGETFEIFAQESVVITVCEYYLNGIRARNRRDTSVQWDKVTIEPAPMPTPKPFSLGINNEIPSAYSDTQYGVKQEGR